MVRAKFDSVVYRPLTLKGFSNIYPIPSYQAKAVATYFATDNPPYPYYSSVGNNSFGANGGIYNRLGRGYPDGTLDAPLRIIIC